MGVEAGWGGRGMCSPLRAVARDEEMGVRLIGVGVVEVGFWGGDEEVVAVVVAERLSEAGRGKASSSSSSSCSLISSSCSSSSSVWSVAPPS